MCFDPSFIDDDDDDDDDGQDFCEGLDHRAGSIMLWVLGCMEISW